LSAYLPNYDVIEHWRKFEVNESDPDDFAQGVKELLGDIDKILEINNWRQRTKQIVHDALEYFDDYADGQYDSDNDSDVEDKQRSELRGFWKMKLFDIVQGSQTLESLIDNIRGYISNGTNYDIVESTLLEDAKGLADEIITEKTNLVKLAASLRREIGLDIDNQSQVDDEVPSPHVVSIQPISERLRSSDRENLPIAKRLRTKSRSKIYKIIT
jgi:hypothetical protein